MIRVLQVFHRMDCGGAENFLMNVYRKINREEIQFDFVVHSTEKGFFDDEIKNLGGRIFYAPPSKFLSPSYKKFWKKFFSENRFDAVHAHMYSTSRVYLKVAKRYGIKTICHIHGTNSGRSLRSLIRKIILRNVENLADVRLACSKEAGEWVYKTLPFTVVNNGINVKDFLFDEETREEMRRKLGLTDEFAIGHAGRFHQVKNHGFLLEVFKLYHEKNPRSVLLLAGDGALRSEIEQKAKTIGISDSVKFLGVRSDLNKLYQTMDCFVFPSFNEGLGIVLIEAQASGLPCLVSDGVPREAAATDLVYFESLSRGAEYWAERVRHLSGGLPRAEYNKAVKAAGFDAETAVRLLEEIYRG